MISATPASDLTPPPPLPPPQVVAVTAQAPAAAPAAPPPPRPPRPGEAAGLDRSMGTIVIYESAVRAGRGCLVGMTRHARQGGSGSGAPARQHCRTLLANAPCFPACLACQCTSQRILLYGLLACQRTAVSSALPLPPSHPAGGCAQDADKLPTWLIVLMCMIALGAQSIFFVTIYRLRKIRKAKQAAAAPTRWRGASLPSSACPLPPALPAFSRAGLARSSGAGCLPSLLSLEQALPARLAQVACPPCSLSSRPCPLVWRRLLALPAFSRSGLARSSGAGCLPPCFLSSRPCPLVWRRLLALPPPTRRRRFPVDAPTCRLLPEWFRPPSCFLQMQAFDIRLRMVVARLPDGNMLVVSPIAPTQEALAQLAQLGGAVRHVVLPSSSPEHWCGVGAWSRACRGRPPRCFGRQQCRRRRGTPGGALHRICSVAGAPATVSPPQALRDAGSVRRSAAQRSAAQRVTRRCDPPPASLCVSTGSTAPPSAPPSPTPPCGRCQACWRAKACPSPSSSNTWAA